MIMETILAQFNRISVDSFYIITNNCIILTINDFVGFEEDWSMTYRELVHDDVVEEVLEWVEKSADYIDNDDYYHFGEVLVKIDYASSDI